MRLDESTQLLHLYLLEGCNSTLDTLTLEPKRLFNKSRKHSSLVDPIVLQFLKLLGSLMKDIQQILLNTHIPTHTYNADHIDPMNFPEFQQTVEKKYGQPCFE